MPAEWWNGGKWMDGWFREPSSLTPQSSLQDAQHLYAMIQAKGGPTEYCNV